jgi:hypothetical protein
MMLSSRQYAQQPLYDDECVQRSDLRSEQPSSRNRSQTGGRLSEPRGKRLLLLGTFAFLFVAMMNNVPWPLCSSFVFCLVLIWLRNTERNGGRDGWPLYEQSVQVSETYYIAVFNITHVFSSINAPRRYAIESIGLAVGTIRSVGWHAASQLARRMHEAVNPDIFPPCPDQCSVQSAKALGIA